MEWAADGKFEDHASLVFLNRRLPVPKFQAAEEAGAGTRQLTIKTDALELRYSPIPGEDGKYTANNLRSSSR
jgi:alpha-glucosidase